MENFSCRYITHLKGSVWWERDSQEDDKCQIVVLTVGIEVLLLLNVAVDVFPFPLFQQD